MVPYLLKEMPRLTGFVGFHNVTFYEVGEKQQIAELPEQLTQSIFSYIERVTAFLNESLPPHEGRVAISRAFLDVRTPDRPRSDAEHKDGFYLSATLTLAGTGTPYLDATGDWAITPTGKTLLFSGRERETLVPGVTALLHKSPGVPEKRISLFLFFLREGGAIQQKITHARDQE